MQCQEAHCREYQKQGARIIVPNNYHDYAHQLHIRQLECNSVKPLGIANQVPAICNGQDVATRSWNLNISGEWARGLRS